MVNPLRFGDRADPGSRFSIGAIAADDIGQPW